MINRTVKILQDTKTYGRKPIQENVETTYSKNDKEIRMYEPACVSFRLIKNQVNIGVQELIQGILGGYTWTVAHFSVDETKGRTNRTKQNWLGQDIFALDIDDGLTVEEAIERCRQLKMMPTFVYTSYSDTPAIRKFRMVFVAEKTVTDYRDAHAMTIALMKMFPEADEQCKDLSRFYYGGKELVYKNLESMISPSQVVSTFTSYEFNKDKRHYKRNISNFCSETGLSTINSMPIELEVKGGEKRAPLIYIQELPGFPQVYNYDTSKEDLMLNCTTTTGGKRSKKYKVSNTTEKVELIEKFDFEELYNKCPFWTGIVDGTIFPYENELMGIATNLLKLKGGEKRIKDYIRNSAVIPEPTKEYYIDKMTYYKSLRGTTKCETYCPRYNKKNIDKRTDKEAVLSCNNCPNSGFNMLHTVEARREEMRRVADYKTISITEAGLKLANEILKAYMEEGRRLYPIKAVTGLGKTRELIKMFKRLEMLNTVMAFPTHELCREVHGKIGNSEVLLVEELRLDNKEILNEYTSLQSKGDYKTAKKIVENYRDHLISSTKRDAIAQSKALPIIKHINAYFNSIKLARVTNKPIICTHKRMLHLGNNKVKTYIVDEDLFDITFQTVNDLDTTKISGIINTARYIKEDTVASQLEYVRGVINEAMDQVNVIQKLKRMAVDKKAVRRVTEAHNTDLNVMDLLNMKAVIFEMNNEINQVKCKAPTNLLGYRRNLLPNAKIIVLSATLNESMYRAMFADKEISFTDLSNVDQVGKLKICNHSMSKTYLRKNMHKAIETLQEKAPGVDIVIAAKEFKEELTEAGYDARLHFGFCEGFDEYKGKDIIVMGTPHAPLALYALVAFECKVDTNIIYNFEYSKQTINGFDTTISTFNTDDLSKEAEQLREIQYYFIQRNLEQAVGRARILREDCTVHLFSNYPLPNITEIYGQLIQ